MAKHGEMAAGSVQAERVVGGTFAALFAVAAMLGTFSDSAVAVADPGWDTAGFDKCVKNAVAAGTHPVDAAYSCCVEVGADWLDCKNRVGVTGAS
jgi:hypothetical protein